jgi:hypothetical protein
MFIPRPALAQTAAWGIDPVNSTARLFVASSSRPGARVNVAVARLNGEIRQDADESLPDALAFQISPADKNAKLLQQDGGRSVSDSSKSGSSTIITFLSKAIEPAGENTIRVRGDLTATYTSWSATYEPTKDYSGPIFGPPVKHVMTREVVFVFRKVARAGPRKENLANFDWSAASTISSRTFPVLWNAVVYTYWPTFVLEEQCVSAEAGAEDYVGPVCEGKVVEPLPRTDLRCLTGSPAGNLNCTGAPLVGLTRREDESGVSAAHDSGDSSPDLADEVEIELHLRLVERKTHAAQQTSQPLQNSPTS